MQCNQPFSGNSYNTGQCYNHYDYNPFRPPPQNHGLGTEIVGEGDVTSVTLPDGTVQFFFIPTIKWWAPPAPNNYPYYTNVVNTNNNNYFGSNIGAWFVRTITNPNPQINANPFPRCQPPRTTVSSVYDLDRSNTGFRLKFHNDKWTSTTHLQYFYPCVRQYDCSISLPNKGCASVQVDTPMTNATVCHYEIVCSKPCYCKTTPCYCKPKPCDNDLSKHRSAMSVVDVKAKSQDVICECKLPNTNPNKFNDGDGCCGTPALQLLPSDPKNKRIKLEKKHKTKSHDFMQTTEKVDKSNFASCSDGNIQETKTHKPKDVICKCGPPVSTDKSMATYTDRGSGAFPNPIAEIQCCLKDDENFTPEMWLPKTDSIAKYFECPPCRDISDSSCGSCYCQDSSEENKQITDLF